MENSHFQDGSVAFFDKQFYRRLSQVYQQKANFSERLRRSAEFKEAWQLGLRRMGHYNLTLDVAYSTEMAAILTSSLTRAPVILNVTLRDLERLKSVAKTLSQLAKVQNIFLKIVLEAHDESISENIQTALEIFGVAR